MSPSMTAVTPFDGLHSYAAMDVPESAADPGGGQAPGQGRAFPGQAQVLSERAGQAQLGVGGNDQPGPPVSGGWVAEFGGGPAEELLEQAERVLQVEAAQERLP